MIQKGYVPLIVCILFLFICLCRNKSKFKVIGSQIHHNPEYMKCIIAGRDNCHNLRQGGVTEFPW